MQVQAEEVIQVLSDNMANRIARLEVELAVAKVQNNRLQKQVDELSKNDKT